MKSEAVHLLIVEDDEDATRILRGLMRDEFGDAVIKSATNVADAKALVQEAQRGKTPFDFVILDFYLPENAGESANGVDETLCEVITTAMPDVEVAHITGHPGDRIIMRHMEKFHINLNAYGTRKRHQGFFFSKEPDSSEWAGQLGRKLKGYHYGARIEETLEELSARAGHPRHSQSRALDYRFAALCEEVERHWGDLEPGLQAYLKQKLLVYEEGAGVRVRWL